MSASLRFVPRFAGFRSRTYSRPYSLHGRQTGTVRVQPVIFTKPKYKTLKTFAIYSAAGAAGTYWLLFAGDEPDEELIDPGDARHSDQWKKQHLQIMKDAKAAKDKDAEEEDTWFIPMTWPRKKETKPYAGSSQEWQAFRKLAMDGDKVVKLKEDLAVLVCKKFAAIPQVRRIIGEPIKLSGHWLIHQFPYSPPQEYERSGIEISNEFISWTSRPVDNIQVARVRRYLMPQPIMESFWGLYSWVGKQWYDRVQGLIWPKSNEKKKTLMEDIITNTANTPERKVADGASSTPSKTLSPTEQLERLEQLGLAKDKLEAVRRLMAGKRTPGEDPSDRPESVLPKELQRVMLWEPSDIRSASLLLSRQLVKTYKPPGAGERLRGSFTVKGEVGMAGPKGQAKMVVWADYHPDHGYTQVTGKMVAVLPHVQSPRGGP